MNAEAASSLDLDSDRPFQERMWRFERAAWALMALLVIAAFAGFTGKGGPFAHARVQAGTATVDYPRISRWQTADSLTVEFGPETSGRGEVLLPSAFTDSFAIESVVPQPIEVVATPEGKLFRFAMEGNGRKSVNFAVRAGSPSWWTEGDLRLGDDSRARLGFVVLP
jgi:hypothetical protein